MHESASKLDLKAFAPQSAMTVTLKKSTYKISLGKMSPSQQSQTTVNGAGRKKNI